MTEEPNQVGRFLASLSPELRRVVATDDDTRRRYAHDEASLVEYEVPEAVARPTTTGQVAALLRAASAHEVPIVPRGAGSGLSGGANATEGCVVLSVERMDRVLAVDVKNLYAVVQPGVINARLKDVVREHALWYPPDPSSFEFCSVGGNVATNAGGLCCVKYGVTRDYVMGLEVVLASGDVIRTGRKTMKGVAGYDLTALFVGSEGTLGVITEATLRLRHRSALPATVLAVFASLRAAGEAIAAIRAHFAPSLLEIMDTATIRAVERHHPAGLDTDAAAVVIVQSDAGGDTGAQEIATVRQLCESHGADPCVVADSEEETRLLLAARRAAYPALQALGAAILDDVAVPCSAVAELCARVEQTSARHGVVIGTFGHAGDGNMHPTIVYDPADEASCGAAQAAFSEIVMTALELGGTVTGEHGVGLLKRGYLRSEVGDEVLALYRGLKAVFDPAGILNPGKAIA